MQGARAAAIQKCTQLQALLDVDVDGCCSRANMIIRIMGYMVGSPTSSACGNAKQTVAVVTNCRGTNQHAQHTGRSGSCSCRTTGHGTWVAPVLIKPNEIVVT